MRVELSKRFFGITSVVLLCTVANPHLLADAGMDVYLQNCAVCHGDDGAGAMPGVPDLRQSTAWLKQDTEILVKRIQQGIQSPDTPVPMPPNAGNPDLTAQQLKAAVLYLNDMIEIRESN